MSGLFSGSISKAIKRAFHPDISIFHKFVKPPYGGGNQFSMALCAKFEELGYAVETNRISRSTRACLFNSFNFDFDSLRRYNSHQPHCRMVHRVDGPITVYRGRNDGSDEKIRDVNQELADATIFQSKYSFEEHKKLGLEFINPIVIMNGCDPSIFNRIDKTEFKSNRKIKLLSNSWSDNPNKGGPIYKWLEEHIDWSRFEYTFVGRSSSEFERLKVIPPVGSFELAAILKEHDIYITASRHDPCSNSLIEALSCGLPAVFLDSGGHSEIVGQAGEAFIENEEAIIAIDKVVSNYHDYQKRISVPDIRDIALSYLKIMGINGE